MVKEVVLFEKLLIFEEMDFIELILLDELICYIGFLVFVYYKFFNVFVEGSYGIYCKYLLIYYGSIDVGDSFVGIIIVMNLE